MVEGAHVILIRANTAGVGECVPRCRWCSRWQPALGNLQPHKSRLYVGRLRRAVWTAVGSLEHLQQDATLQIHLNEKMICHGCISFMRAAKMTQWSLYYGFFSWNLENLEFATLLSCQEFEKKIDNWFCCAIIIKKQDYFPARWCPKFLALTSALLTSKQCSRESCVMYLMATNWAT